ncbi:Whirly transcription factor [Dillenia turbinata]|uniref:Whirly transcription factor n=1 Tax=Dillenia turbinata TaxID=194707 RepID=A0AAN8UQ33_9MAGN
MERAIAALPASPGDCPSFSHPRKRRRFSKAVVLQRVNMRPQHQHSGLTSQIFGHLKKTWSGKFLIEKGDSIKRAYCLNGFEQHAGFSTTRYVTANGSKSDRVFAPYSVFKGKAALSVDPFLPTFSKLTSGGVRVDRRGGIMMTFWPAHFALSATEVGSLISLGAKESCEFFHDPSMKSSNAGQVRKSLAVKPQSDGSGYMFSLSVVNNILKSNDRFSIPITAAEFAVLRTAFSFALPHIMGWDRITNQPQTSKDENSAKVVPELLDLEWDK